MTNDALIERLRACAADPMWADHAEIPKAWCAEAADEIERLRESAWKLENNVQLLVTIAVHQDVESCVSATMCYWSIERLVNKAQLVQDVMKKAEWLHELRALRQTSNARIDHLQALSGDFHD